WVTRRELFFRHIKKRKYPCQDILKKYMYRALRCMKVTVEADAMFCAHSSIARSTFSGAVYFRL
ncbi:hypothetical protein PFISCL1PPCAC_25656, partial [Pristionchus fissidentatus]